MTIICGSWIHSGPHLRDVVNIDGTGLETFIGGTLIVAVTNSANDNIVPLGLLFTNSESVDNALPFMVLVHRLYPHQQFLVTDSGRAFEAAAGRAGFTCHGSCSWHVRDKNACTKVQRHCRGTSRFARDAPAAGETVSCFPFAHVTLTSPCYGLFQIGRPKEPNRAPVLPHIKSKKCRGCNALGRRVLISISTCCTTT